MAQLLQAFDARNVDPTQGVGGLPIGKHPVIAVKSEVKPTKDNDSGYLQFDLQVIDGPNKGAVGAYRLNLYHSSQQTVEIAHKQFSALCHVTGVFQVQNSEQLHNIPFMVEVGLQKEPNPNKYTDVKRVFDINGNEPGQAGKGNQQQQPANNNGGNAGWGGNNGGGNNNGQQQQQQQQQQQPNNGGNGGGNNAGWGGQTQIANNVSMPDNNGGNNNGNNGNNGNNNGGYDQNNNGQQQQQQQQQQNNQQQQQQQQPNNNTGNGGGWAQNGQGNGGGNNGAPSWGQPRN